MSASPRSEVMNFLNEVAGRYPSAVSLAAGRPTDELFGQLTATALVEAMTRYAAADGVPFSALLQYGRTAGLINALMAKQLRIDEGVPASAERLLVTAGCQEAMSLCLASLCAAPGDVALVCNPTYIGATGAANACGIAVHGLSDAEGDLAAAIERAVVMLRREGRHPRVLYLIPDFDNPTGLVLDRAQRIAVLEACTRHRIVVLEDNPYGMFRYDGEPVPPMAALDESGCVIYLSTYSKTLCPAVRVGSAVLPETLFGDRAARVALFDDLVARKSYLTVNTGQISQAIVGGQLLLHDCSLRAWIQPAATVYRDNRNALLAGLHAFLGGREGIAWNRPEGGFFLTLDLPFRFDADAVAECANDEGVIVMPMAFFALDTSQDCRIRLAFSATDPAGIAKGVEALARYVTRRLARDARRETALALPA